MAVPYTFATATTSIPLSQLDSNFATTITLGNTAIQLGNTVTTLNNMTLGNVTLSGANVTVSSTNVIVTSGNVLVGTTTGPVSGNGTVSIAGTGTYTYTAGNAATTSGQYQSLEIQNSTVFNSTGAAGLTFNAINSSPIASHDATGGTTALTVRGGSFFPLISSSATTSILSMNGINSVAQRNYSTDISAAVSNLFGVQATHGHSATLSTSATTINSFGINITGSVMAGGITNYGGFRIDVPVNPTAGTVNLTNVYGVNQISVGFGNSTGTATATQWFGAYFGGPVVGTNGTITNLYGVYLAAPTVTGTVTNRYGIYQADTAGTNYFAANVGIGTTSPTSALDVSGKITAVKGSSGGITIGDVSTNSNSVLRMQGTSAGKNWQIANNLNVAGLEFTPSTTNGGTTFTTPAVAIDSSGNVGIGTTSPNASAILDAQSTTKGVRFPNMTTTQKNAISSPAAGLVVFDTTLSKLAVYSGAAWQTITSV